MDTDRINLALRYATDTLKVVIDTGALAAAGDVFEQCFGKRSAVIVADDTTYGVAGSLVQERLVDSGRVVDEPFVFPAQPVLHADYDNVLELESALRRHDAVPVVVGSGTLNDLAKLAAHRCGRPCMVVATAASMDGYAAYGAAITQEGFKRTIPCPAPRAVIADLEILAHAPREMTASGYADLLGKVTAGADWLIADALEVEKIDTRVWPMVQDGLRTWVSSVAGHVPHGDLQAIRQIAERLILVGLAMQAYRSSRPASGSEHQFSHLWEMQQAPHGAVSHGFKVGLGTIASAALYEILLGQNLTTLDVGAICSVWPTRDQVERIVRASHSHQALADSAVEQSLAKYVASNRLGDRLELLRTTWSALRHKLKGQLLSADKIRGLLRAAGCPTHPDEIGVNLAHLRNSYILAQQIRSRYTVFDLAVETGSLPKCLDSLFAPGGFWGGTES